MKETIGGRISALQKRDGLTQEELAAQMGVSPQAVSKWENEVSQS
ncbi:helix-turn-helix transcriptional regulator [Flavonifractor plautii]|nr:helix-turn-helix transcriptional regulator [Flavonifractor plautii]MBM6664396.1 helix-turn-helix transcriptional regulator [Flavonifractor plautii]